jgi:hypothetical protein
LYN